MEYSAGPIWLTQSIFTRGGLAGGELRRPGNKSGLGEPGAFREENTRLQLSLCDPRYLDNPDWFYQLASLSRNVVSAPWNQTLRNQALPNFLKFSHSTTGPYPQCDEFINKPP